MTPNTLFELELWQFLSFIEGFKARTRYDRIRDIELAWDIGMYVGQYHTGKKAPKDPSSEIKKLLEEIGKSEKITEEDEINDFKKDLQVFNKASKNIKSRTS